MVGRQVGMFFGGRDCGHPLLRERETMEGCSVCVRCGAPLPVRRNPIPTVDTIIAHPDKGVVLVERRFPPLGWALPGGFVDYGETVEQAAVREALEETNLRVRLRELFGVYSDPSRDARGHTISTVFIATADLPEALRGGDDAGRAVFFPLAGLPADLAFDHAGILKDFKQRRAAVYGL